MQRNTPLHLLLLLLIPYMMLVEAFGFVVSPVLQLIHLTAFAGGVGMWLIVRVRGGWAWHPTALDGVIWLWVIAAGVATLANLEDIRRAQPLVWFVSALLVGWYLMHDSMANGTITRLRIVDAMLVASGVLVVFGIQDLYNPYAPRDGLMGITRIASLTGNPNILSAILVPTVGLAFGRAWSMRGTWRVLMSTLGVASLVALVMTYSRGGWVGCAAVIGMLGLFAAAERGWMSLATLRGAWRSARGGQRGAVIAAVVVALVVMLVAGVVMVRSFSTGGRSADLRTYLWEAAWEGFLSAPLTGNGLFTTPRIILDRSSVPPMTAQPHAHNFPLQVLSEMGLLGGVALVASIVAVLRAGLRAWRAAPTPRERHMIAGGFAAAVGFGVHNIFDLAAWIPYVAFTGLMALLVMTAPPIAAAYPPRRGRWGAWLAGGMGMLLIITGAYSYTQVAEYAAVINDAHERTSGWADHAPQLAGLIARDPRQPVYRWSRAMLYATEAHADGDPAMTALAIEDFEAAAALGMDSAALSLNLAGLYAQAGDAQAARQALARAVTYAQDSLPFLVNAALAAERFGLTDAARDLWAQITADPRAASYDIALYPAVRASSVAADFALPPLTDEGRAALLITEGRAEDALAVLGAGPLTTARASMLRALAHHALGQDAGPDIEAALSQQRNNTELRYAVYAQSLVAGEELPPFALPDDPTRLDVTDEPTLGILARLHFMRGTFRRLLIPQVGYEWRDAVLAALISAP